MSELCDLTARELARLIHGKEVSAREVMTAHLARIDRVNPAVNAIVTLLPEAALEAADTADVALARGDDLGPLHGLPIAHKDLFVTAGIRTTFGSLAFRDHVPDETALIVERERQAGAITIGKTNTPELGAGSQTFNEVFGATRNPYDLTKTCGGSSGGGQQRLRALADHQWGVSAWPRRPEAPWRPRRRRPSETRPWPSLLWESKLQRRLKQW